MAFRPPFVPLPTPLQVRGWPRALGGIIPKLVTPKESLNILTSN